MWIMWIMDNVLTRPCAGPSPSRGCCAARDRGGWCGDRAQEAGSTHRVTDQ